MSLFSYENESLAEETNRFGSLAFDAKVHALQLTYETKQRQSLEDCFGEFNTAEVYKYFSDGAWSMHHMVQYFLENIGPSDVHISTWTITEGPARILYNLKEAGLITTLSCLFDYRIQDRSPKSFQLIESISDKIKLTKCHAKIAVMLNQRHGVSIVGSSNFSKNKRLESGTVFTNRDHAIFDFEILKQRIHANE